MKKITLIILLNLIFTINIFGWFDGGREWASGQGVGLDPAKTWIGDFNGDGMDDKLQLAGSGDWWVALSNGAFFNDDSKWATNLDGGATKYFIGDFNGDGMDDIMSYRSNGEWKLSTTKQSESDGTYEISGVGPPIASGKVISTTNTWVADFNGDGIDEVFYESGGVLNVFRLFGSNWNIQTGLISYFDFTDGYFGDVNGDGRDDFIIYKESDPIHGNDCWLVSLSIKKNEVFGSFTKWVGGQGEGAAKHFFADLNGDRKADKINFNSNGEWKVAFAGENSLASPEVTWTTGQGYGVSGVYVGDYNGDNQSDIMCYTSWDGRWYVGLNLKPQAKTVATWFTAWYAVGDSLYDIKRDTLKTPVVGWDTTVTGLYESNNPDVINKQIDAMIAAGINLLIVDITNGWVGSSNMVRATTDSLFAVMSRRDENNRIKIAIGLGKEFWGERELAYVSYPWVGWGQKLSEQNVALGQIYTKYIQNPTYNEIYFHYLNRPLVVAYIGSGLDYHELSTKINKINLYNDFTIKLAITWQKTYPGEAKVKDVSGDSIIIYVNGQSTKRFWGWGAEYQQPYNKEQMAVIPGSYIRWNSDGELIPRETGNYYTNSWKRVLEVNPNMTIIGDWNNWNEETSIEGCEGTNGWKDLNGNYTFDWYLQITRAYTELFRNNLLLANTYYRTDGNSMVYLWNGSSIAEKGETYKPIKKPIIVIPANYTYTKQIAKTIAKEELTNQLMDYNIDQNYPNPFNPSTTITYQLPRDGFVTLKIYDVLGNEVTTLVNEYRTTGSYDINFNASSLSSGVYIYSIKVNDYSATKKLVLLK